VFKVSNIETQDNRYLFMYFICKRFRAFWRAMIKLTFLSIDEAPSNESTPNDYVCDSSTDRQASTDKTRIGNKALPVW